VLKHFDGEATTEELAMQKGGKWKKTMSTVDEVVG